MRKHIISFLIVIELLLTITVPGTQMMPQAGISQKYDRFEGRLGTAGRLFIPQVNIDVALYWTDYDNPWEAQDIVDANDSAAIFPFGVEYVIADHNNQAFSNIHKVERGMHAYIKTETGVEEYYCVKMTTGGNGPGIYTNDDIQLSEQNEGGIAMYTCRSDWWDIYVALWQPVPKANYLPQIREETK